MVTKFSKKEQPIPLYYQLKESLKKRIETEELPPDSVLPTESSLMAEYNVSRITVVRALSELTREGRIHRVQGKGTFVAKPHVEQKGGAKTKNIGFIIQKGVEISSPGPFFFPIFTAVAKEVKIHGYNLLFAASESRYQNHLGFSSIGLNGDLDGVITLGRTSDELLLAIDKKNIPLVLIDYWMNRKELNCIIFDNFYGAYAAVRHLISLGHRRIGFIGGFLNYSYDKDAPDRVKRHEGYKKALQEAGITYDQSLFVREKDEFDRGKTAVKELLKLSEPPTAIFAFHDEAALSAIEEIKKMGLKIPDDIAIVGFDDIEEAAFAYPPLTTVRVPKEELGERAVMRLLELMKDKHQHSQRIVLPVELVIRESCGQKNQKIAGKL